MSQSFPSVRIPLLANAPGLIPAGRKLDRYTLNVDVAPTVLDLLGLEAPAGWHGRSLVPLLRGDAVPDWRQEFVYEATLMMRSRLFSSKIFERMGLDRHLASDSMRDSAESRNFNNLLYANVVPNMKKIGLLDGFLEKRFAEMDILKFQDVDTDAIIAGFIEREDAERKQRPA